MDDIDSGSLFVGLAFTVILGAMMGANPLVGIIVMAVIFFSLTNN